MFDYETIPYTPEPGQKRRAFSFLAQPRQQTPLDVKWRTYILKNCRHFKSIEVLRAEHEHYKELIVQRGLSDAGHTALALATMRHGTSNRKVSTAMLYAMMEHADHMGQCFGYVDELATAPETMAPFMQRLGLTPRSLDWFLADALRQLCKTPRSITDPILRPHVQGAVSEAQQ